MAKNGHSEFSQQFFPKRLVQILEWPKIAIPNFFLTIFPKKTKSQNVHSEFIQTFLVQKVWYKFGMAKNGHSEFISSFLVQKDWKKFGMVKIRHSKFIQICNGM